MLYMHCIRTPHEGGDNIETHNFLSYYKMRRKNLIRISRSKLIYESNERTEKCKKLKKRDSIYYELWHEIAKHRTWNLAVEARSY